MTQLSPYINFNGECRQAMHFYQECLGGELHLQTIAGSPIEGKLAESGYCPALPTCGAAADTRFD